MPFLALLAPIRSPLIGSFVLLIAMPPLFLLKQIDISLRLPRTGGGENRAKGEKAYFFALKKYIDISLRDAVKNVLADFVR